MPPSSNDDTSSLERARERLYETGASAPARETRLKSAVDTLPQAWEKDPLDEVIATLPAQGVVNGKQRVRAASIFFVGAFLFFFVSLAATLYISFVGGNAVSVDKVSIILDGPTSVAGGDTVPLTVTVTNTNAVAIQNATLDIDFPESARSADDVSKPFPRYTENLGTLASGASVTRSIKVILFGGTGQSLSLPASVSYGASGSNAVFVKKTTYSMALSSSPLEVSVNTIAEAVSGQSITFSLTVRSNATVPIDNVVLAGSFPFGFTAQSSSQPLTNSSFLLGTLAPGASKSLWITGPITGQEGEDRVFHFTIGTAASSQDQNLAVQYMTQDASVHIAAPFINTSLAINGNTSSNIVLSPGATQTVKVAYTNTLSTPVTNATISVALLGTAIDYSTVQSSNGFYNSSTHTVVFSRDTNPSLAVLTPGASGFGTITFSTLPASSLVGSPNVTLTTSVSGTRVGQANVPEQVSSSATTVAKVSTSVVVTTNSLHTSGPLGSSGPIPPVAGQPTTYTIEWGVRTLGSAVAGATMSATLPNYVSYTGKTAGSGNFSYDAGSRTVTWTVGDIPPGTIDTGDFEVSLTPSTSQRGSTPLLTGRATFSGYDRFAGTQISGTADPVTTETRADPGYIPANAVVQ